MSYQDPEMEKMFLEAEKFLNQKNHLLLDNKNNNAKAKDKDKDKPLSSSTKPISISNDNNNNPDSILIDYKKRLKNFGFPDIGNISLSQDESDKEKTLKFFDYLIHKKAKESAEYQNSRNQSEIIAKKYEILEAQNIKLEKEIIRLNDELKTITKNKKDYEGKVTNTKESYEKQLLSLKNNNTLLTNKVSRLIIDKRSIEEKLTKLSDAYNKITNKQIAVKPANNIEITDYLKQNELGKMLSKVKGAEKLVEMLKSGYNESLRELLFEISSLKNFIYEIHNEIKALVEYPSDFNADLMNLTFLDTISKIKIVFMQNIQLIKVNNKVNKDENGDDDDYIINMGVNHQVSKFNKGGFNDSDKLPDFDHEEDTSHYSNFQKSNLNQNDKVEGKEKDLFNSFAKTLNMIDTSQNQGQKDDYLENYEQELEVQKNRWTKTFLQLKDDNHESND